jgi:hypothetical protein
MAYQETGRTSVFSGLNRTLTAAVAGIGVVADALVSASLANRRLNLVQGLQMKSDDELAELGIEREEILRHVFIDQHNA